MVSKTILCFSQLALLASAKQAHITFDVSKVIEPWTVVNRFFGCDEADMAFYPHGEKQLKEIGQLSTQQAHFRTHNLLTTGRKGLVGVPGLKWSSTDVLTLDSAGNAVYNFTYFDKVIEAYLDNNVKPYLQLGFMPLALASNPYPYFFNFSSTDPYSDIYTGWSHPPTSYDKWEELAYEVGKHLVSKYGTEELDKWYFEIWNEPNIGYWNGTTQEFYDLWDHAVTGIRKAYPNARIGGPEVAGGPSGTYLNDFLDHTANGTNAATHIKGTELDFVSFHAKGSPIFINTTGDDGYIQMNVSTQLQQIDAAFAVVASYPEYKDKPVFCSECDPDGCAACTSAAYNYRNDLLYPSYTAESFMRALELAHSRNVTLEGLLTWAFEYEKTALLPDETAYYDGFRVLSTQEIDKAVLNVHRMWGMMSGNRIEATSTGQLPMKDVLANGIIGNDTDVGVVATHDEAKGKTFVFAWHYNDNQLSYPDADVTVSLNGLSDSKSSCGGGGSKKVSVTHYRIDESHSNAYPLWVKMGSPQPPSAKQIEELMEAAKLTTLEPTKEVELDGKKGSANLEFKLPIHAISLLVLEKA